MDKNLKIVYFGTPEFVIPVVDILTKQGWLVGVVTAPDKKAGRDQHLESSDIAKQVSSLNIPVLKPEKLNEAFAEELKKLEPDLLVVGAYGKIIPQSVIDIPKYGALNIHPSLLPKYRGGTPIQAAILAGDSITGVTIIKMDEKMDHGPIISRMEISLSNDDTLESMSNLLFQKAANMLVETVQRYIENQLKPKEQEHDEATFCKLIKKEDGYLDVDNPPAPLQLDRMIRAYYPWPTAWTKWKGKVVKLLPNQMIQIEGKKVTSVKDFLNGYPDFPLKITT